MGIVLSREPLVQLVASRQGEGERAVFTNGIFDLLHLGHVRYLQHASTLGDFLIVGLNSDASAQRLKGPNRPHVPEEERAEVLAALACVDYITIFGEDTATETLALLSPTVYVKGGDYAGEAASRADDYLLTPEELRSVVAGETSGRPELAGLVDRLPEAATVADYGGSLALLSYLPGHSTSELIERIVARYGTH
ncbi:MAG TPA: adenylyltransferase/cytidyltransferase family protein [Ktedonobacterales bacterium]|jgi:D-beta-D-heptose 7-phosphate kinase/D-beta-D-heptose 1-phosphate adenosyltransferase|nr:adenylyltransferase/cytidyltransferase family protein [Ktedonobacterales bacterium]